MARLPRLDAAGLPQHVIVRGVNRQPCFFCPADRGAYLNDLRLAALAGDCAVHAYVLMTNHVHLLVTGHAAGSVSALMQSLGRRYVRRFNQIHCRTGTLFEGRCRASLVQSDRYLWACMRYIELNPVRAGMVKAPRDYPWSSYTANAEGARDRLVVPHSDYLGLGKTHKDRAKNYLEMFARDIDTTTLSAIREHTNKNCALGDAAFQGAASRLSGRPTQLPRIGRPPTRPDRQLRTSWQSRGDSEIPEMPLDLLT